MPILPEISSFELGYLLDLPSYSLSCRNLAGNQMVECIVFCTTNLPYNITAPDEGVPRGKRSTETSSCCRHSYRGRPAHRPRPWSSSPITHTFIYYCMLHAFRLLMSVAS